MADKQPNESIYRQILNVYEDTHSVQQTAVKVGVSRNTVQRVLITEDKWESGRSRDVVRLAREGKTADQIANELYLSLKCVQNYMPYTRGMHEECVSANAKAAILKRERMKAALEAQGSKFGTIGATDGISMNEEVIQKERIDLDAMMSQFGEFIKKEDRPNTSVKKYDPAVFKLKLELVDYDGSKIEYTDEEKGILNKYAKMRDGFVREVIVPSSMSLNALNYMIQRLYGWQNSHLHSFVLPEDKFNTITDNGALAQWKRLCGVLFRLPDEDYTDKYCADNYDGTKSFKSWLKSKYCGAELPFSVGDTYIDNQMRLDDLENACDDDIMFQPITLGELREAIDIGGEGDELLERLSIGELLCPENELTSAEEWWTKVNTEIRGKQDLITQFHTVCGDYLKLIESIYELRQRRITQVEMERIISTNVKVSQIPKTPAEELYLKNKKEIEYLESHCRQMLSVFEPKITPLTDSILYRYDYGDGWCVKVTCIEGYYINNYMDFPNEQGWILMIVKDKDIAEDWDFYNCSDDQKITGEYVEKLRKVADRKSPICLATDGIALLDDVGGIGGFIDMLKTLHGENLEEAEELREWANRQGWFGRAVKVENML